LDTLTGARFILQTPIPHRHRLAVILLDSAFETACRSYWRFELQQKPIESHRDRGNLVKAVRGRLSDIDDEVWQNLDYYYEEIRNDLYHQSPNKTVTEESLGDYREAVEFVVDRAFGVDSARLIQAQMATWKTQQPEALPESEAKTVTLALSAASGSAEKLLVAVHSTRPSGLDEVNEFFRREGDSLRMDRSAFNSITARSSRTKNWFYFNRTDRRWELSRTGSFTLRQLATEQT